MATLHDRLDFVLGKKAADPLAEYFGFHTVNDLLRHYPRKYSDEMTTVNDGEDLEEGVHVTFVDKITKAEVRYTNRHPRREYLVVTLGNRRPKVTAKSRMRIVAVTNSGTARPARVTTEMKLSSAPPGRRPAAIPRPTESGISTSSEAMPRIAVLTSGSAIREPTEVRSPPVAKMLPPEVSEVPRSPCRRFPAHSP